MLKIQLASTPNLSRVIQAQESPCCSTVRRGTQQKGGPSETVGLAAVSITAALWTSVVTAAAVFRRIEIGLTTIHLVSIAVAEALIATRNANLFVAEGAHLVQLIVTKLTG